ncbi:hypothetical protein LDENG_00267350 [Lucifuga dentata]|nr:hypothetical protein LDENG_00267350 [Lucifuga dentata]
MWQQHRAASMVNMKPCPHRPHLCHLLARSLPLLHPSPRSSLPTHVFSSASICWGSSDRKTCCVVIAEAWRCRDGSYLGPLEKAWEHGGGHWADRNQACPR